MASSLQEGLQKIKITGAMLEDLNYDRATSETKHITQTGKQHKLEKKPSTFLVFSNSDLHAAVYHITKSLEDPWNPCAVQSIFVQESCADRFNNILSEQLKPYADKIAHDSELTTALDRISGIVSILNAKTVNSNTSGSRAPIIVYDIPYEHFAGDGIIPVVTLYTFRTVKEAITLSKKETAIRATSIWTENHAIAYEVAVLTAFNDYYINCYDVPWTPIKEFIDKREPHVTVQSAYHFETLIVSSGQKNIVFPFGTIFAN